MRVIGRRYLRKKAPVLKRVIAIAGCPPGPTRRGGTQRATPGMPWVSSSAGVDEWVPDATGSGPQVSTPAVDAPPRKPTLAEQIAATRAKQAAAKAEAAAAPTTEPAEPRKLSLAEQIAATRAKTAGGVASVVPVGGAEAEAAARAERAERFRLKEEAAAAADRAEAAREDEARRQAAELAAAEADRVALAEVEAAMGSRKLSLAEQVKVRFRVRVRVRVWVRARVRVRVRARFRVRVGGWRLAIWGLA